MSEKLVRAALEVRLAAMTPPLETAYENMNFTPTPGVPYQRVNLMRAQPDNPTFDRLKVAQGVLQITLFYPLSNGPGTAEARADALAAWFYRSLTLISGSVTVLIDGDAYVMAGFADEDRWAVPVRIPYHSNINT